MKNIEHSLFLIFERLDTIDRRINGIESYVKRAENAADAANNAAQTSLLALDTVSNRLEILRIEHVNNHPNNDSLVPQMLSSKRQRISKKK